MELSIQNANLTNDVGLERGFEMISKAGFTAIDWCLDQIWDRTQIKAGIFPEKTVFNESPEKIIAEFEPQLNAMKKFGLRPTQAHAAFPAYSKGRPEFADFCTEIYKNTLKLCQYAGCPRLVIHGISRPAGDNSMTEKQFFELNMHMYSALIPTIKETKVMVLLENLFTSFGGRYVYASTCSDPHEAVKYIDSLNALAGEECFGLCLDTGHLNLLKMRQRPYIDILGSRIKALHIHDNSMDKDAHLMPYTGNTDWNEFCDGLRSIGYDGDLNFETFMQVSLKNIEEPLIMPFLNTIHAIGEHFRDKITK